MTEGYTRYGLEFWPYSGALKTLLGWELDGKRDGKGEGGTEEVGKERWKVEVDTQGVSGEMVREMGERMEGICAFFVLFFSWNNWC